MDRQTCATPEMRCILSRSEVLEDVLGLEDVLEYTIWSPWPRKSSPWPWPRSLQVLKNALSWAREQHYFLTCWKWAKVMTNFASSWWTPESLQKTLWRHFFLWRALEFFWTFFLFFFLGDAGIFRKIYELLERRPFLFIYFLWRTLPRCVFGAWPRAFLILASRGSVLGKAVLGLGLFLCPWPWLRALCSQLHLWFLALLT